MNEHRVRGLICLKDDFGIEYAVSKIEYIGWENDEFEYRFTPNYEVVDLMSASIFQGIPGLDLDLHQKEYVRRNRIPAFISERSPSENREDLWMILEEARMPYLNQLEWLIKTNKKYIGDRLYVKEYEDIDREVRCLDNVIDRLTRSVDVTRVLLENICFGYIVEYDGLLIDGNNRKTCYDLLYRLYKKEAKFISERQRKGIERARREGKYQGRKAIRVDDIKLQDTLKRYKAGQITSEEAAKNLGMSKSTFYRRIKIKE